MKSITSIKNATPEQLREDGFVDEAIAAISVSADIKERDSEFLRLSHKLRREGLLPASERIARLLMFPRWAVQELCAISDSWAERGHSEKAGSLLLKARERLTDLDRADEGYYSELTFAFALIAWSYFRAGHLDEAREVITTAEINALKGLDEDVDLQTWTEVLKPTKRLVHLWHELGEHQRAADLENRIPDYDDNPRRPGVSD